MLWSEIRVGQEVIPDPGAMLMQDFIYYSPLGHQCKIIGYSIHLTEKFPDNNYVLCELPTNQEWKDTWGRKKLIAKFKPENLRLA